MEKSDIVSTSIGSILTRKKGRERERAWGGGARQKHSNSKENNTYASTKKKEATTTTTTTFVYTCHVNDDAQLSNWMLLDAPSDDARSYIIIIVVII